MGGGITEQAVAGRGGVPEVSSAGVVGVGWWVVLGAGRGVVEMVEIGGVRGGG